MSMKPPIIWIPETGGTLPPIISQPHQGGSFDWSKTGLATLAAFLVRAGVDIAGLITSVGFYQNSIDFGPPDGVKTSVGGFDSLAVRINSAGVVQRLKSWGSVQSNERARDIVVAPDGSFYIVGLFSGTEDFGGGSVTSTAVSPNSDIYLVKYSADGSFIWLRHFGGIHGGEGRAVCLDENGNPVIAATLGDSTAFDSFTVASGGLALVKLSAKDGSVIWAVQRDPANLINPLSLGRCSDGNFAVSGNTFNLSAGTANGYLAKCSTADGSFVWQRTFASNGGGTTYSLSCVSNGDILATGSYSQATGFGVAITDYLGNINNAGGTFFARYSASGTPVWVKTPNVSGYPPQSDQGYAILADSDGSGYVAGFCHGAISYDGQTILLGGADLFFARLNPEGVPIWGKRSAGATGTGYGLALAPNGRLVLCGTVSNGLLYFDQKDHTGGGSVATTSGVTAPFLAQFYR